MSVTASAAVRCALMDAGVSVRTYVPGYPITNIAEASSAEISVCEKVAMEVALGASASGSRAVVIVKQLGMNLLADPLVISATHTIGAGLAVLVGDDLGPEGSQAEMDSRHFGPLCQLPVFDPASPSGLYAAIMEAFVMSERIKAPAIIRIASSVIHAEEPGPIHRSDLISCSHKMPGEFDRSIWDFSAKGRQQRYRRDVMPVLQEVSERAARLLEGGSPKTDPGIIASGRPAALAEQIGLPLLVLPIVNPLPLGRLREFAVRHRQILIAEEPWPFIESQLGSYPGIFGKLTGDLPYGELNVRDLSDAIDAIISNRPPRPPPEPERSTEHTRRTLCESCPFLPLYRAIARIDAGVAGDAGCSIQANRPPLDAVDMVYGLGSAAGVASGFKRKGVAIIGDYAFAHSGLQGLVNALWHGREMLLVLVQNWAAAMTGGQETPDISSVLKALVPGLRYIDMPAPEEEIVQLLEQELARPGVGVIVFRARCPPGCKGSR